MTAGTDATVNCRVADGADTLPLTSRCVAVIECVPGWYDVGQLHWPLEFAVTLQTSRAPATTLTVASGSAVPAKVGLMPTVAFCAGLVMTGAFGDAVSTMNERTGDAAETLPTSSVATAVMLDVPSGSAPLMQL